MASGDRTPAQRLDCHVDELWRRRIPGSYSVGKVQGKPESIVLFLILPDGAIGQIRDERDGSDRYWRITEHEDGTHTATPSIFNSPPDGWHGYLERGMFLEL